MCDIEFTVEKGGLWILQTRVGKRTARAAVRLAVDMADEDLIDRRRGGSPCRSGGFGAAATATIDESGDRAAGSWGCRLTRCCVGCVVFDADRAVELAGQGPR